jgi:hypothetical protein
MCKDEYSISGPGSVAVPHQGMAVTGGGCCGGGGGGGGPAAAAAVGTPRGRPLRLEPCAQGSQLHQV